MWTDWRVTPQGVSDLLPRPGRHDEEYSNEALRKLGARVHHLRRKKGMTQREALV